VQLSDREAPVCWERVYEVGGEVKQKKDRVMDTAR
jgi:hypothetical protein